MRTPPRVHIAVLGCPKNEADSRSLQRRLVSRGARVVDEPEDATHVVVNTCGFIREATEESIGAVLEAVHTYPDLVHVVMGCMVERYRDELSAEIPEVEHWLGFGEEERLLRIVLGDEAGRGSVDAAAPAPESGDAPPYAYVKISDGCDHRCSFCTIPLIKGGYRALGVDEILAQARAAAEEGARELVLVGQDTSIWRDGQVGLGGLLERLEEDPGVRRIRFMYFQPEHVTRELLDTIAAHPRVCRYLDIPFQHAARPVLRRMNRWGDAGAYLELLDRARIALPDVSIRSTFIVGFPGETEDDFAELVAFAEKAEFDHAGIFAYSLEEGTGAADLGPAVPPEIVAERLTVLSDILLTAAEERGRSLIGEGTEILIDAVGPDIDTPADAAASGRTCRQAPEVDGTVFVYGPLPENACPGEIMPVRITEAWGYDMAARWDAS